jgi:hypothetical protein
MSCRTVSNDKFPAVYEEGCPYGENPEAFISYLAETAQVVSEGDIELPDTVLLNGAERSRMAAENPVAFVAENKMILNDIMGILIGLPPDCPEFYSRYQSKSERKTRYYKSRKGLFGHTLSLFGVTEDHARGHLHWHFSINAGIPVTVLQRFANLQPFCNKIAEVLETIYCCDVEKHDVAKSIVRNTLWAENNRTDGTEVEIENPIPREVIHSLEPIEAPLRKPDLLSAINTLESSGSGGLLSSIRHSVSEYAACLQLHRHQFTCFKGLWGKLGCRLNMGCAIIKRTVAVLLSVRKVLKAGQLIV